MFNYSNIHGNQIHNLENVKSLVIWKVVTSKVERDSFASALLVFEVSTHGCETAGNCCPSFACLDDLFTWRDITHVIPSPA